MGRHGPVVVVGNGLNDRLALQYPPPKKDRLATEEIELARLVCGDKIKSGACHHQIRRDVVSNQTGPEHLGTGA